MDRLTGAIGVAFYLFLGYVFIASQIEFFGEYLARFKSAGKGRTGRIFVFLGGLSIVMPLYLSAVFAPKLHHSPFYEHSADGYRHGVFLWAYLLNIMTSFLAGIWFFIRRRGWRRYVAGDGQHGVSGVN